MPDPDADVVFEERQWLWPGWILVIVTAVAGLLIYLPVLWAYYCEPRSLTSVAWGASCIVGAAWAATVLAFIGQLQVQITRSALRVKRGLLPQWCEWPLSDITGCRTIRYDRSRLIGPYDHIEGVGRYLRAYTTEGDEGVLVETKDGSYLLLGSAQPARLARALESAGVSARMEPPLEPPWAPAVPARPDEVVPSAEPPLERLQAPAAPARPDEALPCPEPPAWEPTDDGCQPRESFLAIARAPLLYRDVEQRDWVKAAVILFAMVFAPAMVLMYGEDVWEQVRAHWSYWIAIALGIPLYLVIPLYIFAGRSWTRVTTHGCATWMGGYRRAWSPEEIVSCRPIDAIDALRGDTVAGAVWAAPLPEKSEQTRPGQAYDRLWAGGVLLTLRSGERVILPSNDPDALCDALAQIGVQRRPQLTASDA